MRRYTDSNGANCVVLPYASLEQHAQDFQKIAATPLSQRDIPTIKAWRAARHDAGLSCGFDDFYTVNGLCVQCRGTGWRSKDGYCDGYQFVECSVCCGTGKAVQS